nr:hypothetical protein [Tanacetum cinerariifolium]
GGEDIARSLTTSESVHAGIGTGAGIETLAVVKHPQHMVGPQKRSHRQHALDARHNLVKVVRALAPRGQEYNLERVVPE